MPSNKNQHFVPRCYLRGFTNQHAAINLFNLDRRRAICRAPIKGQCSGDYFYGKDLRLEHALQYIEGGYASTLTDIVKPGYKLTQSHHSMLLYFWCVQHVRTEAASKRVVQATDKLNDDLHIKSDEWRITIQQAAEMSLQLVPDFHESVSDLKLCLIRNSTDLPFITSDDPAALANRWHRQDMRARALSTGVGSAGALLFLPLTPEILCLFYDGSVYRVKKVAGWANASLSDVAAFNEHQYLRAFANIYFRDWISHTAMNAAYDRVAGLRLHERHRFNYGVFERMDGNVQVFRAVDAEEARHNKGSFVHQQAIEPTPTTWPSLIQFRPNGYAWFNGSGVGYVRSATRPPSSKDFNKIATRRNLR